MIWARLGISVGPGHGGHLAKRMEEAPDGDYQMYSVSPGPFSGSTG